LQFQYIAEHKELAIPIWTIASPIVRFDLKVGIKKNIDPTNFICQFYDFQSLFQHYQFIYTDGSTNEDALGVLH
jgi:hypothetical protein